MYIAAGYLAAIPYFVFFVDYPGATSAEDKVTLFAHHHTSMYLMHLVSFELVALALIVVTLGVYQRLHEHAPPTIHVACVVGLVRAGLLLASVMVFDASADPPPVRRRHYVVSSYTTVRARPSAITESRFERTRARSSRSGSAVTIALVTWCPTGGSPGAGGEEVGQRRQALDDLQAVGGHVIRRLVQSALGWRTPSEPKVPRSVTPPWCGRHALFCWVASCRCTGCRRPQLAH